VIHAQDARGTTKLISGKGVSPVIHAQDARATTKLISGTGVSAVIHAQAAPQPNTEDNRYDHSRIRSHADSEGFRLSSEAKHQRDSADRCAAGNADHLHGRLTVEAGSVSDQGA
jgi:hypothetical protein